jgi:uncharacterized protein YecT (DUF1311 family)
MSLVLVASAAQWACADEEARTETAAANARDSALVHDLVLAGYDSAVVVPAGGRYFGAPMSGNPTVTESPGELATNTASTSAAPVTTPDAKAVPSAESYIGPSCASPAAADQKRCLDGYLARSDAQLNKSYQALITQLKSESGKRSGTTEPATVQRLRTTQRNWVAYRDDECRKRTAASEGALWAPVRARCLEEYSAMREREFDDALAKRKATAAKSTATAAKSTPAKSKATKRTRRAKPKRYKSGWG